MPLKDACVIALFQTTLFMFLVWLEVGRSVGWPDAIVAMCSGISVTAAMAVFVYLKTSGKLPLNLPSHRFCRFLALFVIYSCAFIMAYAIPIYDGRFLHPLSPGRHSLAWLVSFGTWMGLCFAIAGMRRKKTSQPEKPIATAPGSIGS